MASRRREIVALLVDKLKEIDGQAIVAIRQVTQALYARQFNILRAT